MEKIKYIILGSLLGGGVMYLFQNTPETDRPTTTKIVEVEKKISPQIEKTPIQEEEKENENNFFSSLTKEVTKIAEEKKRLKTPDELYEEQHSSMDESEELEESDIIDEEVTPLELIEAEKNALTENTYVALDRTLMPKELEEEELASLNRKEENFSSEDDIPPMEVEQEDEFVEEKEAMPDELKDLETYGDDSAPTDLNEEMPL